MERLVLTGNVMAVAFGGTAKDRKDLARTLLDEGTPDFDLQEFEKVFGSLATPVETAATQADIEWAKRELERNPIVVK